MDRIIYVIDIKTQTEEWTEYNTLSLGDIDIYRVIHLDRGKQKEEWTV